MQDYIPWRHLHQQLGRDSFEHIISHMKACGENCSEKARDLFQEYLAGGLPEVRNRSLTSLEPFLEALNKARTIQVPVRSQLETGII